MGRISTWALLNAALAAACLAATARAESWAQFRGGPAAGVVSEGRLPVAWGPADHVAWRVKLPGVGWSQPIAVGDKIFVTTAESDEQARPDPKNQGAGFGDGGFASFLTGFKPPETAHRWKVLCLDAATGDVLWEKVAHEGPPTIHIHPNNTYATETPVADGERIIAYFGMTGVYCFDLAGNQLWTKDLGVFPMQFGWGTGSSPLLAGDTVYIQCDNDQASFLVALDVKTGDQRWRVDRDERSNWATPYLWKNKLRTELVTAGGSRMRSYDPKSGELLWEMTGSGRTATTPVGDDDLLYVDSYDRLTGMSGVLVAIRPGATGDIALPAKETANEHVAWSVPISGGRIASPLLYQGCLYVLDQRGGVVRCLNAATGEQHYRKRVPGAAGFVSSPWAADGHVYCLDQDGRTSVLAAGPELKVDASNELGEMCWGAAGIVGDCILIRTIDRLYCIGE